MKGIEVAKEDKFKLNASKRGIPKPSQEDVEISRELLRKSQAFSVSAYIIK